MENSSPLNACRAHFHKLYITINRFHAVIHCIAIAFLVYYRVSYFFQNPQTRATPVVPWLLVFASEMLLSFMWLLGQAYRWRPVSRTVFPETLPEDDKLLAIDVFICTVDPNKEPTLAVMNTVLSAMALDYPAGKLHVYLSDDGGAAITLVGMREAWKFARSWLPFCRKYGIKTRCPQDYFSDATDEHYLWSTTEFIAEREIVKGKYENFKEVIERSPEKDFLGDPSTSNSRDHPAVIEVIKGTCSETIREDQVQMPLLVYVSREKRPSHPHHFKAGALNVLLRVSGLISNSPYMLVLDCDMHCNDPSSARQAMCFHLDPKISPSLAAVFFPQKFHNISENDIYDSEIRQIFTLYWYGSDGLRGPIWSGTNFYIKRESLYGNFLQEGSELERLKRAFGLSNELIKSLHQDHKISGTISGGESSSTLLQETKFLASCPYEDHTTWGKEVGFLYQSVLEDFLTGFALHCKGWTTVYHDPPRPQFLGTAITSLHDLLTQSTRWSSGLVDVGISKYCPLIYGPLKMSFLQSVCYAELAFTPLLYCLPLCCFATVPQLCLLNGIPLYPEVPNSFFYVFLFIFISSLSKHLYEVLITGGSLRTMRNEQRIWMIKSVTSHLYGSLDAITKRLGMREARFLTTNKVEDNEQVKRYQMGVFDFQASVIFIAPLVTIAILNMESLFVGVIRIFLSENGERMLIQVFLSFYILFMNYAIIEGMIIRKDKGRIPSSVTLLSTVFSIFFLFLGYIFFKCNNSPHVTHCYEENLCTFI